MSVEIVYYNTASNGQLEADLSALGQVNAALCEDRRSFLIALSKAVSVSNTTVAVGGINALANVLAKGLGLPLTPVDWSGLGIAGDADAALPKGALPLLVGGSVYGMIIENATQCIIAVDSDPQALEHMTETYILPYLLAVLKDAAQTDEAPVQEPAADQVLAEEIPQTEEMPTEKPVEEQAEEQAEEQDEYIPAEEDDTPQPSLNEDEETDLFSDIENDDFLDIPDEKKKHGFVIALICILAVLVIGILGGYFAYTKWWQPKQYDDALAVAKVAYTQTTAEDLESAGMPVDYSAKFAALYKQNPDVIGWLKADGIGIDTPVVTGVRHSEGYYADHLFDGQSNPYGTPYIKNAYDTGANINPNLVIYGNNKGGKGFSSLEGLTTEAGFAKLKTLTTDSALFGEEKWHILSVMIVDADGKDYNYTNNFKDLDADARTAAVKGAVERSVVTTGVNADSIGQVSLTDSFLTLVTPYSDDSSKVIVLFAGRAAE